MKSPVLMRKAAVYTSRTASSAMDRATSLTAFARAIVFDKRGRGLSDRVAEQTLEERVGDVRAVMDAAGSQTATFSSARRKAVRCR
jgi:pimeloyl-ACP methyl ester carboxylesterase